MKTKRFTQRDYIKAHRKASREAEIENHTRPVGHHRIHKSKKVYDRNRQKAEQRKALPSLFLVESVICIRFSVICLQPTLGRCPIFAL